MDESVPIAFYAPLKAADHASPSGDRTMARLLLRALTAAGFQPSVASTLRTLVIGGDPGGQETAREAGIAEATRLIAAYRAMPALARPRLWFTYHVHYKAPDWTGPTVADALRIPYVIAEGSRAPKRAGGSWAIGHRGAEAALDRADVIFVLTAQDREVLDRLKPIGQRLVSLPPFLDATEWPAVARQHRRQGLPRLLAVAMMRPGDKLASYAFLAKALGKVADQPWMLGVAGDGPARAEIEHLFWLYRARVRFHGEVDRPTLARLYADSDLLVWPAVGEAYGMALLEAQAMGCPILAGRHGGVADAVAADRTGVLVRPNDPQEFGRALGGLLGEPDRLAEMGREARRFVADERSLGSAAAILRTALLPLLPRQAAA